MITTALIRGIGKNCPNDRRSRQNRFNIRCVIANDGKLINKSIGQSNPKRFNDLPMPRMNITQ